MTNSSPTNNLKSNSSPTPPEVALCILYQGDRLLLQLRDDIPTILYPGCWAIFGGHLEPGETPETGVKREIWEEIGFSLVDPVYFRTYTDHIAVRHVFAHPLTVPLTALNLQEGWDFGLVSRPEIEQGHIYSAQAQAPKPIGDRHRGILLDFWNDHFPSP